MHSMAYTNGNAALAYDMQAEEVNAGALGAQVARPAAPARPRLDVLEGAGTQSDRAVSTQAVVLLKVSLCLIVAFCSVAMGRVMITVATASVLSANAGMAQQLSDSQDEAAELELTHAALGSDARVLDIAKDSFGMVHANEGGLTLDLSN